MPKNKHAFSRYLIINKLLFNNKGGVSIKDITQKIFDELGESISERTIKGDLQFLKSEFNAPIVYKNRFGYYYEQEHYNLLGIKLNETEINTLITSFEILQQFDELDIAQPLENLLKKFVSLPKFKRVIQFEHKATSGHKSLNLITNLIRNKTNLAFTYKKHHEEVQQNNIIVSPLTLKQHDGMWYLLAWNLKINDYRIYGLDRIGVPRKDNSQYFFPNDFDPEKYFEYSLGISVQDKNSVKTVKLLVSIPCANYFIENPLHKSQQFKPINKNSYEFTYRVFVTTELLKIILAWCNYITVVEPKELREEVLKHLKNGVMLNS